MYRADNHQTLDQLKADIRDVIVEILPESGRKVIDNYIKRSEACKRSRVAHLNDILFHL